MKSSQYELATVSTPTVGPCNLLWTPWWPLFWLEKDPVAYTPKYPKIEDERLRIEAIKVFHLWTPLAQRVVRSVEVTHNQSQRHRVWNSATPKTNKHNSTSENLRKVFEIDVRNINAINATSRNPKGYVLMYVLLRQLQARASPALLGNQPSAELTDWWRWTPQEIPQKDRQCTKWLVGSYIRNPKWSGDSNWCFVETIYVQMYIWRLQLQPTTTDCKQIFDHSSTLGHLFSMKPT